MMQATIPVIAIDGPSGTGKGTVAFLMARELGWHVLDSGAIYRSLGVAVDNAGASYDDISALAHLAEVMDLRFSVEGEVIHAYLGAQNVTQLIRTEEYAKKASKLAAIGEVRAALIEKQRAFRRAPGLVADGRDIGTVIFPDATVKIFLTASAEERAERRYKQLKEKEISVNLPTLLQEIIERDQRDANRTVAPLQRAADAEHIDTTGMSIQQVKQRVMSYAMSRLSVG
jgi:CMP/dCMP kinase